MPIISVHGSTGSPRAEMRRHLKPLALSMSKGEWGVFEQPPRLGDGDGGRNQEEALEQDGPR